MVMKKILLFLFLFFLQTYIPKNKFAVLLTNALNWYFKYQILEFQSVEFTVYDEDSCKILIPPYYLNLMKGLPLKGIKELKVNGIIKEKYKNVGFRLKAIADYEGEQYYAELSEAAKEFNLESPQSFLTRLNSHA
jgi:hypothetical protein